jgi:DNA transformation protein and related proteins
MPQQIKDLKSLGPKLQEMLAQTGITTVAQLRELGAVAAYV